MPVDEQRVVPAKWPDLAGRLVDDGGRKCHVLPIRVYFEDTDFSGLVYHASYVRWCERGRSDFLRLLGSEHRSLFAPVAGGQPKAHEHAPVAGWATEGAGKSPPVARPGAGRHPKGSELAQPKAHQAPVAGGQPKAQQDEPSAFVVRRLNLEYLKPARIDDVLEVTTHVKQLTAATLVLNQRVARGVDLLCTAEVTVVLVTLSGRVLRISKALRGALTSGD